jgi:hypothetical protein
MAVDPKVYELAQYFLQDHHDSVTIQQEQELSQQIQDAVEDYFQEQERKGAAQHG